MSCVVCGGKVETAVFANAWERSRKAFPCCSDACAAAFDPDQHWIPATLPARVSDDELNRLLPVFRKRVAAGDVPTVVTREMLLAGLPSQRLRAVLLENRTATEQVEQIRRGNDARSFVQMFTGLFLGFVRRSSRAEKRLQHRADVDKREVGLIDAALADVDRWDAAVGTR